MESYSRRKLEACATSSLPQVPRTRRQPRSSARKRSNAEGKSCESGDSRREERVLVWRVIPVASWKLAPRPACHRFREGEGTAFFLPESVQTPKARVANQAIQGGRNAFWLGELFPSQAGSLRHVQLATGSANAKAIRRANRRSFPAPGCARRRAAHSRAATRHTPPARRPASVRA